ncbi:MAG: acyl-CoA thioester hydrolase [Verrucomicrobiota bacterium]|jgi:acyl-CoA thioester hydrolase
MSQSVSPPFELTVAVQPADIDQQSHVNNTVYLRWVQDVATAHWNAAAPEAMRDSIGWVVLRHEIDYKTPAGLGDEIVLRTWVGQATRVTFERFTEIRRLSMGGQQAEAGRQTLLATARTLWVPINPETGKPTRVPSEVRSRFSV